MTTPAPVAPETHLRRRLGLLQATALNMSNMVGVGPFITIPLLMGTINGGGPQAMLGWIVGLLIAIPDGLVWAEFGAAMPDPAALIFICAMVTGANAGDGSWRFCSSGN